MSAGDSNTPAYDMCQDVSSSNLTLFVALLFHIHHLLTFHHIFYIPILNQDFVLSLFIIPKINCYSSINTVLKLLHYIAEKFKFIFLVSINISMYDKQYSYKTFNFILYHGKERLCFWSWWNLELFDIHSCRIS